MFAVGDTIIKIQDLGMNIIREKIPLFVVLDEDYYDVRRFTVTSTEKSLRRMTSDDVVAFLPRYRYEEGEFVNVRVLLTERT